MIKATVIVTTWNRREVLEGLLAALGKQTLANADFEVLVCDSESTDGTRGAVEAAAKLYGNIHYVSISANNPSAKRNEGIQRARTDTVIFLDDDVIPEPGLVEAHVRAHEGATGVAFCGQVRYPATWVRRSNYFRFRDLRHIGPARRLDPKNIPFWNIVVMNLSFKRSELLFHVGYFSEEFAGCYGGEDEEFGYRVARSGMRIQYLPDAKGYHHEWRGSLRGYLRKMYLSSRDTWPVMFRVMPVSAYQTKWRFLEEISVADDRRTKLIKRGIRFFASPSISNTIYRALEYTDALPSLFWPAAYLYVGAAARVLGCRDRGQGRESHLESGPFVEQEEPLKVEPPAGWPLTRPRNQESESLK